MNYIIKAGDTLYNIAQRQGVSLDELLAANPGVNPNMIYAGQNISLPSEWPPEGLSNDSFAENYTVKGGDTLSSIARAHGISLAALLAANPDIDPNIIHAGQNISILTGNYSPLPSSQKTLAWGKKVSSAFRSKVVSISHALGVDPSYLMACMAFETGYTFNPAIWNKKGSGAVGLIQFMPATAQALGTSSYQLATMSDVQQLDYVYRYFAPRAGKLITVEDVYMTILWPKAIGKPSDYVIFDRNNPSNPALYVANAGLDYNHDGLITKFEASMGIHKALDKGLLPENASPIS